MIGCDDYKSLTREQLVEEYLSVKLANIVNHIGTDWFRMPTDVPKDPAYWKAIDGNLHEMHKRIAELYHLRWEDCLWMENMVDSDTLYVTDRKFKPIVKKTLELLEKKEAEIEDQTRDN